jgi:hypothetical protein
VRRAHAEGRRDVPRRYGGAFRLVDSSARCSGRPALSFSRVARSSGQPEIEPL